MTWQFITNPSAPLTDPVVQVVRPRPRDIGAFEVMRALPAAGQRAIGPFVFFDQMGPTVLAGDAAMDVRPHPHIGISTITWLFDGEIRHQDSLGYDLVIRPGEVNWMTAGSGIAHSERSPQSQRGIDAPLAGIQAWVALPAEQEEIDPGFFHYSADQIPQYDEGGVRISLIVGEAFGQASPVLTQSPTLYAEINLAQGKSLVIGDIAQERGIYVYTGELVIAGKTYEPGSMLVLAPEAAVTLTAASDCRLMLLGGKALDGPRHLYWNFVSSSQERIEQAKDDWRQGKFAMVPGDDEFIPLP